MDDDVKKASVQSAARLAIALIGCVAAALGHHIDSGILQTLDIATGAFLVAVSAAWSQWQVRQNAAKLLEVQAAALNTGILISDRVLGPTPLVPAAEVPALIKMVAPQLPPSSVHTRAAEALSKP
jgi:hypothetical protein